MTTLLLAATSWVWVFGFSVILVCLYLGIYLRKVVSRRNKFTIENAVNERTAILKLQLDSSRDRESDLQRNVRLQSIALASISHDIKSPVRFIVKSAEEIHSLIHDNQMERLAKAGEVISYTGNRIFHLIEDMSEFFKTTLDLQSLKTEEVNLEMLLKEKISTFATMISTHSGNIVTHINADDIVITNSRLLGMVIHNIIDNAIKAKASNDIKIFTTEFDNQLHLIIADSGPGLPTPIIDALNAKFFDNKEGSDMENGWGIILIKQICNLLHLQLSADNSPGATIHIIFGSGQYSRWEAN